jgi:hypothetical protein
MNGLNGRLGARDSRTMFITVGSVGWEERRASEPRACSRPRDRQETALIDRSRGRLSG